MEKIFNELKSFLKALLFFSIACCLLPFLLLSFLCVHYSNELVNYVLSIKYPMLEISKSKKIRTVIDTQRNAGIFHFLMHVKGRCDFEKIRQYYAEHLTDVRDKLGFLRFPKLRQKLITTWGHYAWVHDNSSFNINNHVFLAPHTYRGRPVHDGNIKDFVSELVTKYIPSDLPQWQVIVIQTSSNTSISLPSREEENAEQNEEEDYYILIKIHHLIIAEEQDLHISEMLMLQENGRKHVIEINDLSRKPKPQSPSYFVRKPVHIQNLLHHLYNLVINSWGAFIYEFESLETPDGHRPVRITNITQLLSVLLIIAVNVLIDYWRVTDLRKKLRKRAGLQQENNGRWRTLRSLLTKEVNQRNLCWQVACDAVRASCHPANLMKTWTKFIWQLNVNNVVFLPMHLYAEVLAFSELMFKGQTTRTTTYCSRLCVYLPMLVYAQMEFFKICYELFKAPVNIYEELFVNPSKEANYLQTKSYAGRKILSYTKSINASALRERIKFNAELSESDFVLSCLAGSIRDYFQLYAKNAPVPNVLNTTCRTISKGYFTEGTGNKLDHVGGIVFLQLPLKSPDREHVRQIHTIVDNIRHKQIMIYLASMGQTRFDLLTALIPRVLTKIFINFFSFNFPVTITQIHGETSEFQTVWGQQVEDVLLFRPPQSKTCLSLNIHRFGDKYRLATMADTQLAPDHNCISQSFEHYMETASL